MVGQLGRRSAPPLVLSLLVLSLLVLAVLVVATACSPTTPPGQPTLTANAASGSPPSMTPTPVVEAPLPGRLQDYRPTISLVGDIAFRPDGRTVASASPGHAVGLWDVETGAPWPTAFIGHTSGSISEVAFTSDGQILASGSWYSIGGQRGDNTVRLWDMATGRQLGDPLQHDLSVHAVAFSPDGRLLASAGGNPRLMIWDVASQRLLVRLPGHRNAVSEIAFGPAGTWLVSSGGGELRFWDVATWRQIGAPIAVPSTSPSGWTVDAIAVSPDGSTVATGGYDGAVHFWRVSDHSEVGTPLTDLTEAVSDLAYSPDGGLLAAASYGQLRLWDLATGRPVTPPTNDLHGAIHLEFAPTGRLLATGSDEGVRFWPLSV